MDKIRYIKNNEQKSADIRFSYKNCNGEMIKAECDTIMDFIDVMESDEINIPMLDDTDVKAIFFDNKHNVKKFDTIEELLKHCKDIIK